MPDDPDRDEEETDEAGGSDLAERAAAAADAAGEALKSIGSKVADGIREASRRAPDEVPKVLRSLGGVIGSVAEATGRGLKKAGRSAYKGAKTTLDELTRDDDDRDNDSDDNRD